MLGFVFLLCQACVFCMCLPFAFICFLFEKYLYVCMYVCMYVCIYIYMRILASIKFVSNCMFTCGGLCFSVSGFVFFCVLRFFFVAIFPKTKAIPFYSVQFFQTVLFFFFERVNELQKTSRYQFVRPRYT